MVNFSFSERQERLRQEARSFADREFTEDRARTADVDETHPRELFEATGEAGLVRPWIDEEWGGRGLSWTEAMVLTEEFARQDSTLVEGTISLPADMIWRYGTDDQRERYLRPTMRGEMLSYMAFTEPAHGGDIRDLDTTARRDGSEWVLNGEKVFITFGMCAEFGVVLAQTDPDANPTYSGQTLFLVESDADGLHREQMTGVFGDRASPIARIEYDDVSVPSENVLGEVGQGFYHSMNYFSGSRLELAFMALGQAEGALDMALERAHDREAFDGPIIDLQAVQFTLADMVMQVEAAKTLCYRVAHMFDDAFAEVDKRKGLWAAIAKTYAFEMALEVVEEAMDIFGGYGLLSEYDIERNYRDLKTKSVYEGTLDLQRHMIGMALKRGEYEVTTGFPY